MAGEEDCSACAFSLFCQEDGAALDAGAAVSDDELFLVCSGAEGDEDEEQYMERLVSKESSFCSGRSTACSGGGDSPSSASMVSEDWFQCARHAAVKWILEARGYFGFGHRTAYLAVAYFDRFCLRRCIDKGVMPWAARLLSIACTSLAAKMEEYRAPPLSDFPPVAAGDGGGGGYEFSCVTLRRMELLVLTTLEWRLSAVTPFDYLPYFTSKLHHHRGGGGGAAAGDDDACVVLRAVGFIFQATQVASVLDYRPSTVALAAVLAAASCGRLGRDALDSKISSLSPSCLLEKEHVYACYSLMFRDSNMRANSSNLSTCDSADVIDTASFAFLPPPVTATNKRMRIR